MSSHAMPSSDDIRAFHGAVEMRDFAAVETSLKKYGKNIADAPYPSTVRFWTKGMTALHYAIEDECRALAELLLNHGAAIEAADGSGYTPLSYAVLDDDSDIETVRMLVARGADVNAMAGASYTILMKAAMFGRRDACGLLIMARADTEKLDEQGLTALDHAKNAALKDYMAGRRDDYLRQKKTDEAYDVASVVNAVGTGASAALRARSRLRHPRKGHGR